MKEEELLEWLDKFVFSNTGFSVNRECVEGHEHCQAYKQIVALIKKPQVTEEWIEEKARELNNEILLANYKESYYNMSKDFIRKLVKEIQRK